MVTFYNIGPLKEQWLFDVKGVTHEPTVNDHATQGAVFLNSTELFSVFQFVVCGQKKSINAGLTILH